MREILFRGKRIDNQQWVEGSLVYWPSDDQIGTIVCFEEDKDGFVVGDHIEVYLDTVGQFTGFGDRNGKRIFEGDIVKVHNEIRSVVFDARMGSFEFNDKDPVENADSLCLCCDHDQCEIIGNIHDNTIPAREELITMENITDEIVKIGNYGHVLTKEEWKKALSVYEQRIFDFTGVKGVNHDN